MTLRHPTRPQSDMDIDSRTKVWLQLITWQLGMLGFVWLAIWTTKNFAPEARVDRGRRLWWVWPRGACELEGLMGRGKFHGDGEGWGRTAGVGRGQRDGSVLYLES